MTLIRVDPDLLAELVDRIDRFAGYTAEQADAVRQLSQATADAWAGRAADQYQAGAVSDLGEAAERLRQLRWATATAYESYLEAMEADRAMWA